MKWYEMLRSALLDPAEPGVTLFAPALLAPGGGFQPTCMCWGGGLPEPSGRLPNYFCLRFETRRLPARRIRQCKEVGNCQSQSLSTAV